MIEREGVVTEHFGVRVPHRGSKRLKAGLEVPTLMAYGDSDTALGPQLVKVRRGCCMPRSVVPSLEASP